MGLTPADVKGPLKAVEQWLIGKDRAKVEITVSNGRLNIRAAEDEVLVQNGKILGADKPAE